MLRRIIILLCLVLPSYLLLAQEQDQFAFKKDSVHLINATDIPVDTLPTVSWHPDPIRAVWLGAICPGLGQMYNRSWWKVPIVYGAFLGSGYAIMTNNVSYNEYKRAYIDLYTDNANNAVTTDADKSYNAILPNGYDIARMGGTSAYISKLNNWQNTYRRYRDISIVVTVAVYALSLVDAYVDAQLFDFDISPDLSMTVEPDIYIDPTLHTTNGEIHLAISF